MRFISFVSVLLSTSAAVTYAAPLSKRAADFVDPHPGGGHMGAQDGGVREPMNVSFSSSYVSFICILLSISSCLCAISHLNLNHRR